MATVDNIYINEIKPRSFTITDDNGVAVDFVSDVSSLSLFLVCNNTIIDKYNWQSDSEVLSGYKEFENVGSDGIVDILISPQSTWSEGPYSVMVKYKTNSGLKDEIDSLQNVFYVKSTIISTIETE